MSYLTIICVCGGAFVFLMITTLVAAGYKGSRITGQKDDWLFSDFVYKLYGVFFDDENPDVVAEKMKIDTEKYYQNCALTKTDPDIKRVIVYRIFAYLSIAVCAIISAFTSIYIIIAGLIFYYWFAMRLQSSMNKKADNMRKQIEDDLPDFLDLLKTELAVGMPIENAIRNITKKYPCLLSEEFTETVGDTKLGASSWVQALERIARKYDVDILNEFVLDVSNAYTKGVSITETVNRKADEVKQSHLLIVKERAGKLTNTILLPMAILQFLPMIMFILIPVIIQISTTL